MTEHWYDEAVIYRLDVETFADSDGGGIGDFRGLVGRLDSVRSRRRALRRRDLRFVGT